MDTHKRQHRQILSYSLATILVAFSVIGSGIALAATADVELFFRPHCDSHALDVDTMLGPIPDLEEMVSLGNGTCTSFQVEDPQTLKTNPMNVGDTLDFDIVIHNTSRQSISHVRSWLAYDTNVFEGISVQLNPNFPLVTPGESDFDSTNGYVMIEGSNDTADANKNGILAVARVQLRAKIAPPTGTIISFYDVQRGGHTTVTTKENGNDEYILEQEPGGLHVIFAQSNTPPPNPPSSGGTIPPGNTPPPPGSGAVANNLLGDGNTPPDGGFPPFDPLGPGNNTPPPGPGDGNPPPTPSLAPDGSACIQDNICTSNKCVEGICVAQNTQTPPDRTAFALLQVRNLRTTTEGSSVFLAWDALNSSSLKGYNIYYGTTSGQYIQRKTVDGTMKSLVLRSLPLGTTYYFAIRAVSTDDEESAFSQEVSVEIGNATTSTAPLTEGDFAGVTGRNPVGDLTGNGAVSVPGNTGTSSNIALLFMLCAVVGTLIASKRQLAVATNPNK